MLDERRTAEQLRDPRTRPRAFAVVVDEYSQRLYWHVRRMVLSHDDADDVLQNTFVKAWLALDNFRGDARLGTWLFRIATNEALNHLEREQKRGQATGGDQSLAEQLEGDPYFDGDETWTQLQQAIAELPLRQRQVFQLKYFDEMPYEEMSRMLDTSVGALKASYHHAVKKIAEYFDQND